MADNRKSKDKEEFREFMDEAFRMNGGQAIPLGDIVARLEAEEVAANTLEPEAAQALKGHSPSKLIN